MNLRLTNTWPNQSLSFQGILGNVTLDGEILQDWEIFPLQLDNILNIPWDRCQAISEDQMGVPSFYYGSFSVQDANDTFLKTEMWTKVSLAFMKINFCFYLL